MDEVREVLERLLQEVTTVIEEGERKYGEFRVQD